MKYKKGEFGYWWTVEKGNEDIEGAEYKGYIDCSHQGLASLRGAPKIVHGYFSCEDNCLTTLRYAPERVLGSFYCANNLLTSLKGSPKAALYFDCSHNKLVSLEGAPRRINASFRCEYNELTSLEGAPKNVGRYFFCHSNNLTSVAGLDKMKGIRILWLCKNPRLTSLPDDFDITNTVINGDVYTWRGSTWSFFNGVRKEILKIRKSGSLTVYTMKDGTYAVYDGEEHAHGNTLKKAKEDLIYKRTSRDLSEYKSLTLDSKLTLEECIKMYRSITGACSLGTKEFCSQRKLKKAYTVREVIELTEGEYGNEKMKEFFYGEKCDI